MPRTSRAPADADRATPLIGSLLRLPHEVVTQRLRAALDAAGFDISPTELGVFLYPGPDGRRPSDLARQCAMTRQAMNYVLQGLEKRGYLRRDDGTTAASRVVAVTDRGREVFAVLRATVAEVEAEWSALLGAERFDALRSTLSDLAGHYGKLPSQDTSVAQNPPPG
jgi:DNA-binding MarR family transcriptional regulator